MEIKQSQMCTTGIYFYCLRIILNGINLPLSQQFYLVYKKKISNNYLW